MTIDDDDDDSNNFSTSKMNIADLALSFRVVTSCCCTFSVNNLNMNASTHSAREIDDLAELLRRRISLAMLYAPVAK